MNTRPDLEAALAKAEAKLQRAVKEGAVGGVDKEAATETLDKARASCREARAALTRLDRAGS